MFSHLDDPPESDDYDSYLEDRALAILEDADELAYYLDLYGKELTKEAWEDYKFLEWLDDRLIDEAEDSKLGYLQAQEDDRC